MSDYKIGIALMGKGSTNNLHREEVVDAFRKRGVSVKYIVREDYEPLLEKLPGTEYAVCRFRDDNGRKEFWRGFFRYMRQLYPSDDAGKKSRFVVENEARHLKSRISHFIINYLARYRFVMAVALLLESIFFRSVKIDGVEPGDIDQLLLLGVGSAGNDREGYLTWWARGHGIPVVHSVGNYDNLSSKGYHGAPIDTLLVWGPSMAEDAERFHGVEKSKITQVGSIRYNSIENTIKHGREDFLREVGLRPDKKTILFAGSLHEFHYFETLAILRRLNADGDKYQMIMRVYPNKRLMNSAYAEPLIEYASGLGNVHVSLADPHFSSGTRDREVLQIEEYELWHSLKHCDVVVNLFSTISLEACIFDKPVINMWYFAPPPSKIMLRAAVFWDYSRVFHNKRMASYGATETAHDREEVIQMIKDAMERPDKRRGARKRAVESECGLLDGGACERLAEACVRAYHSGGAVK